MLLLKLIAIQLFHGVITAISACHGHILAHGLCFNRSYTLKDSEVLLTPMNEISHSKKLLILYGRVQGFTVVCLYRLYGKLDTLLHI